MSHRIWPPYNVFFDMSRCIQLIKGHDLHILYLTVADRHGVTMVHSMENSEYNTVLQSGDL